MKEKVTYVRQLLVFGGGKIGGYRIVKILIYVSLKIRRNTMSIVYYSDENLLIRSMEIDDAKIIYETYLSYGWNPSMQTYQDYYKEQKENKRKVFIAEYEGEVSGLCTLVMNPTEGPLGGYGYPEIVDLTVFFHVHNKGIGNKLLDVCEREAAKVADTVYLAVGVHSGYGAAQRIYFKRGYIPDGSGVWYKGKQLEQYASCCNDDDLLLFMSKNL